MTKLVCLLLAVMASPLIAGCAGSGVDGLGGINVIGDENGGQVPRSVGAAATQSSAYEVITAHCAKFGKKAYITRMDFEGGTMTFECRQQQAKPKA